MSKKEKEVLTQLAELLRQEKAADFEQFKNIIQSLTLDERRSKGYTWYPLQVIKTGYTIGDRAFVIVEKTSQLDKAHQFRPGKTVSLFTQQDGAYAPEKIGVIKYVVKNKMNIILNTKDLPDWIDQGHIGVDLVFDERTYLEMERALQRVIDASGNRLAELRSILTGFALPQFMPTEHTVEIPNLNPAQNQALNQVLAARDLAVIHGPPGTGKTTTLVETIKVLSRSELSILVCAPSNAAVDLLTERLAQKELQVLRIGNISRVDDQIIKHTLDSQLSSHPESKNIKKVKIQAAQCRKKAQKFKRKFGAQERNERRALREEAKSLSAWANQLEDRLIDQIISQAQVICCTLVGAAQKVLQHRQFKTIFIDEAAQALEPACWIPISKADRVVLAGDPFQLPPTIKSNAAAKAGLAITLIEKCISTSDKVCLLNIQYRMHEAIMGFSNQQFYQQKLIAHESVKSATLDWWDNQAVVFIDTAGCGFEEEVKPEQLSKFNPGEVNILQEHLLQLLAAYKDKTLPDIGIISPYKEQVRYLRKNFQQEEQLKAIEQLSIDTIDAFQGQERSMIYISLVRSNEKGVIGFLKDYRRMNVAMTRAKMQLVVIGDSATIGQDDFYAAFLDYCEAQGNYKSAWEYMQQ
ncbi:MAG: AAA domain-containing protein [Saprospiraceae bacterium]